MSNKRVLDPGWHILPDGFLDDDDQEEIDQILSELEEKDVKCECGAEKVKTTHSNWCPKYDKA